MPKTNDLEQVNEVYFYRDGFMVICRVCDTKFDSLAYDFVKKAKKHAIEGHGAKIIGVVNRWL